jgi:DNA (cytosine-5)-methyltransferase 1
MKLKILDLFSGLGGFSLGLERTGNFETIAFCDNDRYSNLVLQKHWKGVKVYNDVKEITKERLESDGVELPDIITGGFPCQPFSVAGKQKGTSDDRHLWPEMFRIIQELKPRWVIGENVKGLVNLQDGMVFETVCTDLEGEGYEVRAFNIPAAGVGAPHRRERIWIVAHRKESMVNADDVRLEQHNETKEETSWWRTSTTFEPTSDVVNTISNGERREISRSDEEERRIQEEHRQDNSSARLTSRTSSIRQTNNGHEDMEDSRRTLQQGTELREKNEDEVREGYANQHQRSGSPSESNVADTYARLSNGTYEEVQSRGQTSDTSSKGSTDVANTKSSDRHDNEAITRDGGSSTQEVFGNGSSVSGESSWWHVEPNVGRVAHGIPGRVYRLKGLGNSIVPKIAEEIGKAIIKAEREE